MTRHVSAVCQRLAEEPANVEIDVTMLNSSDWRLVPVLTKIDLSWLRTVLA